MQDHCDPPPGVPSYHSPSYWREQEASARGLHGRSLEDAFLRPLVWGKRFNWRSSTGRWQCIPQHGWEDATAVPPNNAVWGPVSQHGGWRSACQALTSTSSSRSFLADGLALCNWIAPKTHMDKINLHEGNSIAVGIHGNSQTTRTWLPQHFTFIDYFLAFLLFLEIAFFRREQQKRSFLLPYQ